MEVANEMDAETTRNSGRMPTRKAVAMKKCSCCDTDELQPNASRVCKFCKAVFPKKRHVCGVKGKTNQSEQSRRMLMRAQILKRNHDTDTIMISVNPTASGKHLSLKVQSTSGLARKYVGESKALTTMGELIALSFLKFESSERNIPVDIKRWRRTMKRNRDAGRQPDNKESCSENDSGLLNDDESITGEEMDRDSAEEGFDPDNSLGNLFDKLDN